MHSAHFKIRFRHPVIPGKFLVVATELKPEHTQRIEKLVVKHQISLEAGMELAAVMNIVCQQPDLIPVEVIRITEAQYEALATSRRDYIQ